MFLSNLVISNYRSIKELSLKFEKGKNIIVGKNNAGKSNIIKAIDLVLGENSPTWQKSDNVTEKDFFNGNTKQPIFIFCELQRDNDEPLNYDQIYLCFGYKYHAAIKEWREKEAGGKKYPVKVPIRHKINNKTVGDFVSSLDAIMNVDEDDVDTFYVNPKLKHQGTFELELDDKHSFGFGFRACELPNGKIHKEIRFLYREDQNADWVLAFSAPIRNELLQSAIIHSFRDPQNELRINQWSWFGKLLKAYVKSDDPDLLKAFGSLKEASAGVFKDLQADINAQKIKVAFPHTTVSFQFNPDTKLDVYKSAMIYVDDGFNSLLQEKGSGIQSAVIIGLYNYYTNKIAHTASSLLAVEEPEIYLHPQARRVISSRIDDFLQGERNQVIITTHSTEFITSAHENLNIIVAKKFKEKGTEAKNTKFEISKEKQILVKIQNAEMFFADKVILVEGGDKYILESIAKYFGVNVKAGLGEDWLNEHNVSVIAVGGKSEFCKYVKKLNELEIPVFVFADFDFFLRELSEFFTHLKYPQPVHDELNALRSSVHTGKITFTKNILNHIESFANAIIGEGIKAEQKDIKRLLKEPFRAKRLNQLHPDKMESVVSYLKRLHKINLFILHNELEDYYTPLCNDSCKGNFGKEEKPIHIVSRLVNADTPITSLITTDEFFEFLSLVEAHTE